jgi:hypothetical protein
MTSRCGVPHNSNGMARRRFVVGLLVAFAIACGGDTPTSPGSGSLQFTPHSPEPGTGESTTAEASQGQIDVRATLRSPDSCRTLHGELEQTGRQLTLRVSIRPTGAVCVTVIGRFAYDASIVGLVPGRYSLQVIHTYPSTGWPTTTVLNDTFDVR